MSYSEIFNRSWHAMRGNLAFVAALTLVYMLAMATLQLIPVAGNFFIIFFSAGYANCLAKIRKGQEIGYKDFFWGFINFNRFLQLLILNVVMGFGVLFLMILLVVPGIWFSIAVWHAVPVFVLKTPDAFDAIKGSLRLTKNRWWFLFGLIILLMFLQLGGLLCLLIGILITTPMITLAGIEIVEHYYTPPPGALLHGEAQGDFAAATAPEPPPIA